MNCLARILAFTYVHLRSMLPLHLLRRSHCCHKACTTEHLHSYTGKLRNWTRILSVLPHTERYDTALLRQTRFARCLQQNVLRLSLPNSLGRYAFWNLGHRTS